MTNPLDLAARQLGMNETDQRAALSDYLSTGGVNLDPAVTAWCAAYVNSTLKQAGFEGTGSNMARDFLDWGVEVSDPQRGDIAVFSRGDPDGPYGHVGFFDGYNPDGTLRILGGNQGDAVSMSSYGTNRLLGFRRPEAGWGPQNALAYANSPEDAPRNALAQPQPPKISNVLDPAAFMNPRRGYSIIPI